MRGEIVDDFKNITTWVFDLDDTLYSTEYNLLSDLKKAGREAFAQLENISYEEADRLFNEYAEKYGVPFGGIKRHHQNLDKDEFIRLAYGSLPVEKLTPCAQTAQALAALKGRKALFSNSPLFHIDRVLNALELENVFDEIFDAQRSDFEVKPNPKLYVKLFEEVGASPESVAFIEDSPKNLLPAHELGWKTVLVNRPKEEAAAAHVHHHFPTLLDFLKAVEE